jgi:hypothetical protein
MYSNYQLPPKMFADLIGHYPRNAWPYPHPVLWKLAQDKKSGFIGNALDYFNQLEKKHPYLNAAIRFTPVVSTVPATIDIARAIKDKKYWLALARLGALWVPFGPEIASALKLAWRPIAGKTLPWRHFIDFWGWGRGLNNDRTLPGNEPVSLPPSPPRPS